MKEIVEGKTRLLVPAHGKAPVFYNPRMKLNRDLCVAVVKALKDETDVNFLDLLAGTGAKGLRVAKEANCRVALNDANPRAWEVILKNAELNGLEVEVYNRKANQLLQEVRFNFIDIDPFGTPVPFLDNAVMALKRGGFLGVTATDTAPLCGVHTKACLRKYGAVALRTDFCHEMGMRILIGYIARTCAKHGAGASPLLSHYSEHYFRVYVRVVNGKKEADQALSEIGHLYYCRSCLSREHIKGYIPPEKQCECGAVYEVAGPMWLGRLCKREFLKKVLEKAWSTADNRGLKTLRLLLEEIEEPFYYDLHKLCKAWKTEVPPMDEVLGALRSQGFEASRTHYSPTGIKSKAAVENFKKILK